MKVTELALCSALTTMVFGFGGGAVLGLVGPVLGLGWLPGGCAPGLVWWWLLGLPLGLGDVLGEPDASTGESLGSPGVVLGVGLVLGVEAAFVR
ncbi:hypothetical protein [Fodinicola acaciae]|uniref:hypothetical protein n=1 Tax=Fodinicola acaciae TaxID=2681555 RepID=UPI0013D7FE83|nr:hypothetical protein [Fodinicola acaciae]